MPSDRDVSHLTLRHRSPRVKVLPTEVLPEWHRRAWAPGPASSGMCPARQTVKPHNRGTGRYKTAKSHKISPSKMRDTPHRERGHVALRPQSPTATRPQHSALHESTLPTQASCLQPLKDSIPCRRMHMYIHTYTHIYLCLEKSPYRDICAPTTRARQTTAARCQANSSLGKHRARL